MMRVAKYCCLTANVGGTYKNMTPNGWEPFSESLLTYAIENFRQGDVSYKRGCCMIRLGSSQANFLRAAAFRQSSMTSAAESTCMHAMVDELYPEEFEDIDKLIQFRFASDIEIVNNTLSPQPEYYSSVEAYPLDNEMLFTILKGCFASCYNKENPVFLALNDDSFDNDVNQILKAVYSHMPFAMRAQCGFITHPTPRLNMEFVSLCFIRKSAIYNYESSSILYPDDIERSRYAMQEILYRSKIGVALDRFIRYLANSTDSAALTEMFEAFKASVEGMGDPQRFSNINCGIYGDAYNLITDWENMTEDEKVLYILDFLRPTHHHSASIVPLADQLFASFFDEALLKRQLIGIVSRAVTGENPFLFYLHDAKKYYAVVDRYKKYLQNGWAAMLADLVLKCNSRPLIKKEFEMAKETLEPYYQTITKSGETVIDIIGTRVEEAHAKLVAAEKDTVSRQLNEIDRGSTEYVPTADYLDYKKKWNACSACFENLVYDENEAFVVEESENILHSALKRFCAKSASKPIWFSDRNDVLALFTYRSESAPSGFPRAFNRLQQLKDEYDNNMKDYERVQQQPASYFAAILADKNYPRNDSWNYVFYILELHKFVSKYQFKQGDLWDKLIAQLQKDVSSIQKLININDIGCSSIAEAFISFTLLECYGRHDPTVLLSNGSTIKMSDAFSCLGNLLDGKESSYSSSQIIFLTELGCLTAEQAKRVCSPLSTKKDVIDSQVALAKHMSLRLNTDSGENPVLWLSPEENRSTLEPYRNVFIKDESQRTLLEQVWDKAFAPADISAPESRKSKKSKIVLGKKLKIALSVIIAVVLIGSGALMGHYIPRIMARNDVPEHEQVIETEDPTQGHSNSQDPSDSDGHGQSTEMAADPEASGQTDLVELKFSFKNLRTDTNPVREVTASSDPEEVKVGRRIRFGLATDFVYDGSLKFSVEGDAVTIKAEDHYDTYCIGETIKEGTAVITAFDDNQNVLMRLQINVVP